MGAEETAARRGSLGNALRQTCVREFMCRMMSFPRTRCPAPASIPIPAEYLSTVAWGRPARLMHWHSKTKAFLSSPNHPARRFAAYVDLVFAASVSRASQSKATEQRTWVEQEENVSSPSLHHLYMRGIIRDSEVPPC